MYRFTGVNIDHFIGAELIEVSIVQFNLLFSFETEKQPNIHINIEGTWCIEKDGQLFDEGDAQKHKESIKAHCLLGHKIISYKTPTPESLEIQFDGNSILTIYDNSDQYESCSISPHIII